MVCLKSQRHCLTALIVVELYQFHLVSSSRNKNSNRSSRYKKRANGAIVMLKSFKRQTHTHTQTDRQTDGYPVAELFSTVLETMGLAPISGDVSVV